MNSVNFSKPPKFPLLLSLWLSYCIPIDGSSHFLLLVQQIFSSTILCWKPCPFNCLLPLYNLSILRVVFLFSCILPVSALPLSLSLTRCPCLTPILFFHHRMDVAHAAFGSLSHLWSDLRLSRATKLRLYLMSVCSTLTHSCEAWAATRTVVRMINGFNSRCLHAITGEDYRTTATVPVYNLVLAVRKRRLSQRYLGHVLRLPAENIVRRSLLALVEGGAHYAESSLFSDCEAGLPQLEALSLDRSAWRDKVSSLTRTVYFQICPYTCINVVS